MSHVAFGGGEEVAHTAATWLRFDLRLDFAFEWNGLSSAAIEVGADAGEPWLAAVGGAAAAIK